MTRRLAAATIAGLALSAFPVIVNAASAQPAPASQVQAAAAAANGAWTVYHHDNARTGYDSTQPTATGATTGWVSPTLDGSVYAEPLVYNGMVFAATLQGTVYALNQSDGLVAWSTNVGAPRSITGTGQCGNVNPLGILSTPVIDATAGRIYVSEILAADSLWHVFGVDLTTHLVVMNTPIPTTVGTGFNWTIEQQRGALGLANGYVYVPFGGRAGDCGPYHGWVIGVPTSGSTSLAVYETPSTAEGIWAPGGVVIDDSTGNVFFTTGNAIPCSGAVNSDSVIRTAPILGLATSFFQPQDWSANWCGLDEDMGSVTPVLISPSLMFTTGKWGQGFLLNPASLGGTNGQLFPSGAPYTGVDVCLGDHGAASYGSVAYAYGRVYFSCEGNGIVSLSVNSSTPSFSSCDASCTATGTWHVGGLGTMSSPIVAGGAVWAISTSGGGLYGFNATTGAQIFHSANFSASRFSTPSEAGGQIFAGAGNVIRSFNMTLNNCTSVTASAAPPSPSLPGTPITFTASASGCPNPLYQFWILPPGSSTWQIKQAYSSAATFNWNTTGLPAGNYLYTVWARDASGTGTFCGSLGCEDAYFPGTNYTLTTQPCASVTESATPASPQLSGTGVTFTASASGCPNPLYQFWILPPGSSTWQIKQAYSSMATFNWTTTGLPAGNYLYTVWARDASSSGTSCGNLGCEDAYFPGTFYRLTTTPCTSVTESAAPASPQASGTAVTFTASASGCPNPLYQFWILPPGSSTWQIKQAYSSMATFNWTTTGLPAGNYLYTVWVRDASSSGTSCGSLGCEDAYFPGTAYRLTTTPCTSVTESAAPASPQASGTAVAFTASASGCPNPLYQFWILPPGSSTWQVKQAYSSMATFNWTTTGLAAGNYLYTVWVRDASSPGTSCGSLGCEDAYFPGTAYRLT